MDKLKKALTGIKINYDMMKEKDYEDTVYNEEDLEFIVDILSFD
ncbi:MAG TPA: hypothetical protein PK566_06305 [Pseudobacteroides sp.]|nr:hypothetical protein [Pseudobacteroides sp.]